MMKSYRLFVVALMCCILSLGVRDSSQRNLNANNQNNGNSIQNGIPGVNGMFQILNRYSSGNQAPIPGYVNKQQPVNLLPTVMEQVVMSQLLDNRMPQTSQIKPHRGSIAGAGTPYGVGQDQVTNPQLTKQLVQNLEVAQPSSKQVFEVNTTNGNSQKSGQSSIPTSSGGTVDTSALQSTPIMGLDQQNRSASLGDHQMHGKLDDAWKGGTEIIESLKTTSIQAKSSNGGDQQESTSTLKPINVRTEPTSQAKGGLFDSGMMFKVMKDIFETALFGDLANKSILRQANRDEGNSADAASPNQQESSNDLSPEAVVEAQLAEPTGSQLKGGGDDDDVETFKKIFLDNVNLIENKVSDQLGIEVPTMMIENGDSGWMETFAKQVLQQIQERRAQMQQSRGANRRDSQKPSGLFEPLRSVLAGFKDNGKSPGPQAQVGKGSQVTEATSSGNNGSTLVEKNLHLLKMASGLLNNLSSDNSKLNHAGLTRVLVKVAALIEGFMSKSMIKQSS